MMVNRRLNSNEAQNVTAWLTQSNHSYVIDMLTGDTVLTGNIGSGAPFTTHLDPGQGKLFKVVGAPTYINGTRKHVAWQGKITLDGDVTIDSGWTMKILSPKAQIILLANRDTLHTGVNTNKVELIVKGKVVVQGTSTDTVKFVSSATSPGTQDWYGIRINTTTGASGKFEYGLIKNAYTALDYRNSASDTVKNCLLQENDMYAIYSKNGNLVILYNNIKDSWGYGIKLDSTNTKIFSNTIQNVNFGIDAYKSFGYLSSNIITTTGAVPMEYAFRAYGSVSTQQSNFIDDSISGRFIQAAVVANGGTYLSFGRIWSQEEDVAAGDYFPLKIGVVVAGTGPVKMRSTRLKMSGFSSQTNDVPAIQVSGTSNIDLNATALTDTGTCCGEGNSIYRAGSSKAIENLTSDSILARNNYWGANPTSAFFSGSVKYQPYVTCAPTLSHEACGGQPKVSANQTRIPSRYVLHQNYPNPFNPATTISFSLPKAGKVTLEVYNILGERVKVLVNEERPAGTYQIEWNGTDKNGVPVSSGLYFYKIEAAEFREVKQMVFLK